MCIFNANQYNSQCHRYLINIYQALCHLGPLYLRENFISSWFSPYFSQSSAELLVLLTGHTSRSRESHFTRKRSKRAFDWCITRRRALLLALAKTRYHWRIRFCQGKIFFYSHNWNRYERGRGFRCAELIHFGLQPFCLLCCSTHIAHITELDNNISAHQVLWSSYTFFHLAQKLFEPDGRKRLSFIKVGMNVHWYLVYNSLNIGLLQSQTWQNWKAKTLFSVPTLFTKQINSNSYKAL